MRRRVRQHVNALSLRHLDTNAQRLSLPPHAPVEVELGCGDAEFLFQRCLAARKGLYIGVEIRRELVDRVNQRAQREGLSQLRAVYANLLTDLSALFPASSVDLCHINFPDPFFKRSQHKRRFVTEELVNALGRVLKPGGEIAMQTDIFDLALEALDLLERSEPLFVNEREAWRFTCENPFGAKSRRERRCELRGVRIWRLRFRRSYS